jgi:hypothetical protein
MGQTMDRLDPPIRARSKPLSQNRWRSGSFERRCREHQIGPGRLPSPDQIPGGLLRLGRDPHRHHLIQAQQPGQMQRVPGIFSELENADGVTV